MMAKLSQTYGSSESRYIVIIDALIVEMENIIRKSIVMHKISPVLFLVIFPSKRFY